MGSIFLELLSKTLATLEHLISNYFSMIGQPCLEFGGQVCMHSTWECAQDFESAKWKAS